MLLRPKSGAAVLCASCQMFTCAGPKQPCSCTVELLLQKGVLQRQSVGSWVRLADIDPFGNGLQSSQCLDRPSHQSITVMLTWQSAMPQQLPARVHGQWACLRGRTLPTTNRAPRP